MTQSPKINYPYLNTLYKGENTKCWCFYFEKAELARQNKNWDAVFTVINDARAKKLAPENDIEWTTYVEACLYKGKFDEIERLLKKDISSKFAKSYVYQILQKWNSNCPVDQREALDSLMKLAMK